MQVEHCHLAASAAGQDDADEPGRTRRHAPSVAPGGFAVCDVAWPDEAHDALEPDQERGVVLTTAAMPPTTNALPRSFPGCEGSIPLELAAANDGTAALFSLTGRRSRRDSQGTTCCIVAGPEPLQRTRGKRTETLP
jgi:hypothetical protein